jgi:hypothetical protein
VGGVSVVAGFFAVRIKAVDHAEIRTGERASPGS